MAPQAKSWSLALALSVAGMIVGAFIVATFIATRPSPCCGSQVPFATIYREPLSRLDAVLNQGDGHAFAVVARDPLLRRPAVLHGASELAYRAQRPVWAYLTWAVSLGQPELTGWVLVALSILACGASCGVASLLLQERHRSPWWALGVPAFGFESLVELTPELFAVSLLGAGVLLWQHRRYRLSVLMMVAAALTRETLLVGVAAFACWELVSSSGDLRRRVARMWTLGIPFAVYAVWVVALRLRLGAWPVHRSNDRLSLLPGAGLYRGIEHASNSTTIVVWAALGLTLAVATVMCARHDPLTWIVLAFTVLGVVLGPEVWSPAAGYQRTLLPLFYFAPIALLGAVSRWPSHLWFPQARSSRRPCRAAAATSVTSRDELGSA